MPPIEAMYNLEDFETVAKDVLAKTSWAYYESAGDDEYSKRENVRRAGCAASLAETRR